MPNNNKEAELREKLADIEHQRWSDWQAYAQEFCGVNNGDGSITIPRRFVERWRRQIDSPYSELSEAEKKSDMDQVDRYWPLIQAYIASQATQIAEIVICAGIKLKDGRVLRCHRHGDGMLNAHHNGWELTSESDQQGFITSTGRYVSREEGRKLQDAAEIKSADPEGYRGDTLFSEDLY